MALTKTTESMLTDFKNQDFSLNDEEINQLRQTVKERGTSRERMEEFEEAVLALECYLAAIQKEVEERTHVVTLLEQAEIFYETQRGEAKLVANAYKNFGNRVKSLNTKLQEKSKTLPERSPVPSPSVDAPSPENSDDEDLKLPDSGTSGLDSFFNSSKLADFAKDALGGGNIDLESRLAAFRSSEEVSPRKPSPKTSDPTRDVTEIWPSKEYTETYSHETWETRDTRESKSSRSREERKEPQEIRDLRDMWERERETRESSSSSSSKHREYKSSREHRSSRSSRDSRDSRDGGRDGGSSESREAYKSSSSTSTSSSSRDRGGTEWDYGSSDKSRDREYSHTSTTSYDVPTPVPPPKVFVQDLLEMAFLHNPKSQSTESKQELKPMSAAELLDTFGKAYQSSSSSVVGTTNSSVATISAVSEYKDPKTPTPPNSSIPDLSRPPPDMSATITPTNPPDTETTAYSALPTTTQSLYSQSYTSLDETSPKAATYVTTEPSYTVPYDTSANWAPPPPPPPPPPELQRGAIVDRTAPDYDVTRGYNSTWSEFESYPIPSGEVNDDEADNRNWGEPPGNEELEALASDTPSSPPTFEKGFTGALLPPPLPPAFCARSNLRELVSEGEDSDHRTNLVNIQPRGEDSDYRCYDYSFLSDQTPEPKIEKELSITSLFSGKDDLDLRIKKYGLKQNKDDSGSDMDISQSCSDEDMEISDESGKDPLHHKRGDRKAEKKSHSKESSKSHQKKETTNSNGTKSESVGSKKKDSSDVKIEKSFSDKNTHQNQSNNTSSKSSDSKTQDTDSTETDKNVSKIDPDKKEKRKSIDSDTCNDAKVQKTDNESGKSLKSEGDDKDDQSEKGRDWYKNFTQAGEGKEIKEEPKASVKGSKISEKEHSDSHGNVETTNVIDVIKSLDREFHQQRAKGNFNNSNHNRGGGGGSSYHKDVTSPPHGNGGYYKPQHRGRGSGGPGFYPSPHRGRGGGPLLGPHPYGSAGRGFFGGYDPFMRGRGGRRPMRGRGGRW